MFSAVAVRPIGVKQTTNHTSHHHGKHPSGLTWSNPLESRETLVIPSGLLASLQLLHVPAADGHVALVLVHAVGEALDVGGTGARGLVRAALAVESVATHGIARVGIRVERSLGLFLLNRC